MKEQCTRTIETTDSLGMPSYFPCGNPVKFKVKYTDFINGNKKNDVVCGVHCNSIKKWAKRAHEIFDFDIKLKVTPLTNNRQ